MRLFVFNRGFRIVNYRASKYLIMFQTVNSINSIKISSIIN